MRKLRIREIKSFVQSHSTINWQWSTWIQSQTLILELSLLDINANAYGEFIWKTFYEIFLMLKDKEGLFVWSYQLVMVEEHHQQI